MAKSALTTDRRVQEVSAEDGWALLDEHARRYLGMSGEEFVRAWRAGEIANPDRPEVMRVRAFLAGAR